MLIGARLLLAILAAVAGAAPGAEPLVPFHVEADGIPDALTQFPGDPERGRVIVMGRDSNCLLCHAVPDSGGRGTGNFGPSLAGVGARLTAAQIRLRIVDPARLRPDSGMPSYYRTDGPLRVGPSYRGKPLLQARQVEDVVAYLLTLQ